MNKLKKLICIMLVGVVSVTAMALGGCSGSNEQSPQNRGTWQVVSPDETISATVVMNGDGQLSYTVKKGDTEVIKQSSLGFTIKEDDFRILSLESENSRRVQGSYENKSGKHTEVSYDCNETTLTFKGWKFYLDFTMRAYDDGYAFRYGIRSIGGTSGTVTVLDENTEFALPENASVWTQPYRSSDPQHGNYFAYENAYVYRNVGTLGGETLAMPILYKVGNDDLYSLITESALIGSGYYGTFLAESQENSGKGILQTVHTPAGCSENYNNISYPFTSPWRVGITGTMNTLVGSELIEKVYDDVEVWKPENYDELSEEEKAIYNYDWVEPGVCAWSWLRYQEAWQQRDWKLQKQYVDLAADMGWKYTILDGGWDSDFDEAQFLDFMKYADSKGIKVIVWCDALRSFANGNEDLLTYTLDLWKQYGIAGIKIDFFSGETVKNNPHQGEDIDTIKWYETIYQECAKRKMVVNAHGSNKPTGERRKYPNVINREGIYGNEFAAVDSTVTVNHLFTRAILGASDFTPVVNPRNEGLTVAHQMALAVLFESGLPSMADFAEVYYDDTIMDFYKAIPSIRDEIVFLGGEPDYYYCAAIKAGDDWFVACVNSVSKSKVEIDFSFLGAGNYITDFYTDSEDGVVKTQKEISSSSKESVNVERNSGFIYHIRKQA